MNSITRKLCVMLIMLLAAGVSFAQDEHKKMNENDDSMKPVGVKVSDGTLYGKDYDHSINVMSFEELMKDPSSSSDKDVLVKGNVTEVCQDMGCWLVLSEGTKMVRVKTLHEFFLPKDIAGTKAVVYGKFKVTEISEKMAKHYNDESKHPVVKTEDIKGPQKVFEIEASGVKILNPESDKN